MNISVLPIRSFFDGSFSRNFVLARNHNTFLRLSTPRAAYFASQVDNSILNSVVKLVRAYSIAGSAGLSPAQSTHIQHDLARPLVNLLA